MTKARDIADLGDSIINDANNNVALGDGALDDASLSGSNNVAIGEDALQSNTTASNNTAVGYQALYTNTTGDSLTAVGYQALKASTGVNNTAVGYNAFTATTTGIHNAGLGRAAGLSNTTGSYNVAIGDAALPFNTTASYNTAVGYQAAYSSTTANRLTTVGYLAGTALTTGSGNVVVGDNAFKNATTPDNSVAIGTYALADTTTGIRNTCVGSAAGEKITTGSKNTIIGRYTGNQGGLDIRTSSNNIVLSDGDGNVRQVMNSGGSVFIGKIAEVTTTPGWQFKPSGEAIVGRAANDTIFVWQNTNTGATVGSISITASATAYNTSSDHRLKENVVELTGATDRLKQLNPSRFNFIADADTTVDGFIAHEVQSVVPEAITGTHNEVDADGNPVYQGIDQSKLVPLLVATIKELEARITALEAN